MIIILINQVDKRTVFFLPAAWPGPSCNKTASFLEFSLCLSRACLGKKSIFIYKRLKKTVFSPSIGSALETRTRDHGPDPEAIYIYKRSFYQARLGTNMGKTPKNIGAPLFFNCFRCLSRACLGKRSFGFHLQNKISH